MSATEHVILVDENDQEIGIAEKIQAHRENLRHRAFSIFIFNCHQKDELLVQQRAADKYHSAGLWTNTCCSHPRPGENVLAAGERRLVEEIGITTKLKSLGWFHYEAYFDNGLSENEIDHVLIGEIEKTHIEPNPKEVAALRWVSLNELEEELEKNPLGFTPWFVEAFDIAKRHF